MDPNPHSGDSVQDEDIFMELFSFFDWNMLRKDCSEVDVEVFIRLSTLSLFLMMLHFCQARPQRLVVKLLEISKTCFVSFVGLVQ